MKVSELRTGLQALQTMLSSWECKAKNIADLERIIDLLANYDDLSVKDLSRRIEDALSGEGREAGPTARKSSEVNEAKVTEYMDKLGAPNLDRLSYMAILSELRADKKARVVELNDIANRLTHENNNYRNKNDAIASMEGWVHRKFDTERRLSRTNDLF